MTRHSTISGVVQSMSVGTYQHHTVSDSVSRDAHKEGQPVPEPSQEAGLDRGQVRKVLIVEDAIELAEVIAATLERVNIRTFHETHVERALEVFCAQHPDLILLDISLPDKTGWKLLDEIRAQEQAVQPIFIVITAHGDPANRLMGKLQGVHSYLVKPFTPDEVEQIVEKAFTGGLRRYGIDVVDMDAEGIDLANDVSDGLNTSR